MLIDIIAGARPNFMKIAPIIEAILLQRQSGLLIDYRLIHTGQHYDKKMSGDFFEQLHIPEPTFNLSVGSGTQAYQVAHIMMAYEEILLQQTPDVCLVVGDVNSTMACAITAKKMNVKVAHVEAGIRSGDMTMPEEINRIVTDSITDFFFTTTTIANHHLRSVGIPAHKIFFVGNTMIDTLLKQMPFFKPPACWSELQLVAQQYWVMTLHRPSNVDDEHNLMQMMASVAKHAGNFPVLFPVHPRTKKMLMGSKATQQPNVHLLDPLSYLEFNHLVKNSLAVITDSGGITEETTVMHIPCMTLRDSTERPETVQIGTNELIGNDTFLLADYMSKVIAGKWKKGAIPEKWDGKAGKRIVEQMIQCLS